MFMKFLASFHAHKSSGRIGIIGLIIVFSLLPNVAGGAVKPRIAIVYDNGGRGDRAVNDAAASGMDLAKKKYHLSALDIRELVTDGTETDRENRLRFLAKAGYALIITTGSGFIPALTLVAGEFPATQFAVINDQTLPMINVTSAVFADAQGAFLAGITAAISSKLGKVGLVTNAEDPQSLNVISAFTRGANYGKADTKVFIRNSQDTPLADVAYLNSQKVDVIYSRWYKSGEVVAAISKINVARPATSKIKLIGEAPEQFFLGNKDTQKILIASVLNHVDIAMVELVGATLKGQSFADIVDPVNGVYGHQFSIKDGGIDLSLVVPNPAISAKVAAAKKAILSGQLKVAS